MKEKLEEIIWNTNGVAKFLGRSDGAIRNLAARRRIPFRKAGGRLIFFRNEILEWIDSAPGVRLEEMDQ